MVSTAHSTKSRSCQLTDNLQSNLISIIYLKSTKMKNKSGLWIWDPDPGTPMIPTPDS